MSQTMAGTAWPVALLVSVGLSGGAAEAQAPPPAPPPALSGSVGAGLSLTSGNTDSKQFNLAFDVNLRPNARDSAKFDGLFLRGRSDGRDVVDRTTLGVRDEHRLGQRAFAFAQLGYLRDPFKSIDYLLAPTAGVGLQAYKTDRATLALDTGAGAVWEKNPGRGARSSGAVTAGESFSAKLSATTSVSQTARGLWKTSDTSDALYTLTAGVATSIVRSSQIKIEWQDVYKHVVPDARTKQNDLTLLLSLVYKF